MKETQLIITEEKVLKAAEQCVTAKAVLTTLFPEVFKKPTSVIVPELSPIRDKNSKAILIERRNDGEYQGLGFYLTDHFDWAIIKDSSGDTVLVPTLKAK